MTRTTTILDILALRALEQPRSVAYTYLENGELEAENITYADLQKRTFEIAGLLTKYARPSDRVALIYPSGLAFLSAFFGCLHARMTAVPLHSPRSGRHNDRLAAIIESSDARLVLTTKELVNSVEQTLSETTDRTSIRVLATDDLLFTTPIDDVVQDIQADDIAFLQYTSGSTSSPKGVIVTHRNLIANQEMIQKTFQGTLESIIVGWLPLYHDMGLIGNIFQALWIGARCILMSPTAFLQRPSRWLEAISNYRATISGGPDFAYRLAAERITTEQATPLDLSSWKVAFNGSEPIRNSTIKRFIQRFGPYGFDRNSIVPCYGLAEATLFVAGSFAGEAPVVFPYNAEQLRMNYACLDLAAESKEPLVSSGSVADGLDIRIVDPEHCTIRPADRVGEIWIAGSSVAAGYWHNDVASQETFHARLRDSNTDYLRTGDLGFLSGKELFVTGRLKDLMIVRGRNHYPQDIERTASACHAALATSIGAAFTVERATGTAVVLVQEVPRNIVSPQKLKEISSAVRKAVAEREGVALERLVLVRIGTIPRTTSGKIRRHACREAYLSGDFEELGQRDETDSVPLSIDRTALQQKLSSHVLALRNLAAAIIDIQPDSLDTTQSLFSLGFDSLMMANLRFRCEAELNVTVSLESMLLGKSISTLADEVELLPIINPLEAKPETSEGTPEVFPLSVGQKAIWFLHLLAPDDPAYNLFSISRSKYPLDTTALREAFQVLVNRHPLLRSVVVNSGQGPSFSTVANYVIDFEIMEAEDWSDDFLHDYLNEEANRPFRPSVIPPLRIQVLRQRDRGDVLLLGVHHLITDLASVSIFLDELATVYFALRRSLTHQLPARVHYAHFVKQQSYALAKGKWNDQRDYWMEYLKNANLSLPAPFDFPVQHPGTRGKTLRFRLEQYLTFKVKEVAASLNVSLYALLLASFQAILLRITAQDDLLVGSIVSGRSSADWLDTVGYFVNQVIFRARWDAQKRFRQFIAETQRDIAAALRNQDYPFSLLTEEYHLRYGSRGEPLTRIMFSLQSMMKPSTQALSSFALNHAGSRIELDDLTLEAIEIENRGTQFDLSMVVVESSDRLAGGIQYNAELLPLTFVQNIATQFESLLVRVTQDPDCCMTDIPAFSSADHARIIEAWNQTSIDYDHNTPVSELIERRAMNVPHAIAIRAKDGDLTYGDLSRMSDRIARFLLNKGINETSVVGLYSHRSKYLLVAMLGILKSGAAFLPLDPSLPAERIHYMLEHTAAAMVLTDESNAASVFSLGEGPEVVNLTSSLSNTHMDRIASNATPIDMTPHGLAYVIFTSGSTGYPKGVMVTHRNLANFFCAMDQQFDLQIGDQFLALTSVSFDISILELLWPLTKGGIVTLVPELGKRGTSLLSVGTRKKDTGFSLFYFADASEQRGPERYRLLLEGAKFADANGFAAVWTPERHFHRFGGSYPNPSLTGAAIAAITRKIGIRAGSVVLPLHDPIRVAEEWSTVDNLSGGRVGVAFASGWHVDDFALAPERYADRRDVLLSSIERVQRLWRGDAIEVLNGNNKTISVRLFPSPVQSNLPIWITASGTPATFQLAGTLGANLLTHLLGQSLNEVADNIALYHRALEANDHDPSTRTVTLMLHTFIGRDLDTVKKLVHLPFREYLRSSLGLVEKLIHSLALPVDLKNLNPQDLNDLLDFAANRYWETSGLFGTVDSCVSMASKIRNIGVTEIACLLDFGVDTDQVLDSLPLLREVMLSSQATIVSQSENKIHANQLAKTYLQCTPSMMKLLLTEDDPILASVDMVLLGGEPLPMSLVEKLRDRFRFRIFNMYGPTETTIWSTMEEITTLQGPVSVGHPIANTQCYILDHHRLLAPEGIIGELFIGGDGVTRGYWGKDDLTRERFIPDMFHPSAEARLYSTGDLARYLSDGRIELLGRTDHQVKIRGFRIELSEIEIALESHPEIDDAHVMKVGLENDLRLIAYYVSSTRQAIPAEALRSLLRARLPEYMIPAEFVKLEHIPLMTNGKVDRKRLEQALPAQVPNNDCAAPRIDFPADHLEAYLIDIWKKVLKVDHVELDDNFFDRGGHSLLMIQVHSALSEQIGRQFPLVQLLENPTVRALAKALSSEAANLSDHRVIHETDRATLQRRSLLGLGRNTTAARSIAL